MIPAVYPKVLNTQALNSLSHIHYFNQKILCILNMVKVMKFRLLYSKILRFLEYNNMEWEAQKNVY